MHWKNTHVGGKPLFKFSKLIRMYKIIRDSMKLHPFSNDFFNQFTECV